MAAATGMRSRDTRPELQAQTRGVVEGPIGEGGLNLLADCTAAAAVAEVRSSSRDQSVHAFPQSAGSALSRCGTR